IEPESEADPAGLLTQLLVGAGSAIGRNPHVYAENDRHGANLNVIQVGSSGKARKGTSFGRVKQPLAVMDPTWAENCIATGGLSSGEGLIWAVRDPISELRQVKGKKEQELVVVDPGVSDKRLLVVESEFAKAPAPWNGKEIYSRRSSATSTTVA